MRIRTAFAAIGLGLALASAAPADPPAQFWAAPDDAVAMWAFDPGAIGAGAADRNRALAESALSWAVPASLGIESPLLHSIVNADTLGAAPYRLILLRFAASCPAPVRGDPQPANIETLEAVLEIDHLADPRSLVAHLHSARPGGSEAALRLPGDRACQSLVVKGSPQDAIEWCSDHDSFVVGFGAGSLLRWFSRADNATSSFPKSHESAVPQSGRTVLAAWVNLNSLRQNSPELFAYGRYTRLLRAWDFANSRSLYLSGRVVADSAARHPPLLALSAAWSPRSEPTSSIHKATLSEATWPETLPAAATTDAAYAIVAHCDWHTLFNGALGTAENLAPKPSLFQSQYQRWTTQHASALVGIVNALGPSVIIYGPSAGTHGAEATLFAKPEATGFAGSVVSLSTALVPTAIRSGVTGGFHLQSTQKPPQPWAGLQWTTDRAGQRVEFSWPAPATTPVH